LRPEPLDERARELVRRRHLLVGRVPDPGAAAEIEEPRRPAELVAAAAAERGEAVDGEQALVRARELRADVDVQADRIERLERVAQDVERAVEVDAELRVVDLD